MTFPGVSCPTVTRRTGTPGAAGPHAMAVPGARRVVRRMLQCCAIFRRTRQAPVRLFQSGNIVGSRTGGNQAPIDGDSRRASVLLRWYVLCFGLSEVKEKAQRIAACRRVVDHDSRAGRVIGGSRTTAPIRRTGIGAHDASRCRSMQRRVSIAVEMASGRQGARGTRDGSHGPCEWPCW